MVTMKYSPVTVTVWTRPFLHEPPRHFLTLNVSSADNGVPRSNESEIKSKIVTDRVSSMVRSFSTAQHGL
jgi:hypothetical protein